MERVASCLDGRRVHPIARPRNCEFEGLPFVAEIDCKAVFAIVLWNGVLGELRLALLAQRRDDFLQRRLSHLIERHHAATGEVVRNVRMENAPGRERAGIRRENDALDAELVGNGTGMNRTGTTE